MVASQDLPDRPATWPCRECLRFALTPAEPMLIVSGPARAEFPVGSFLATNPPLRLRRSAAFASHDLHWQEIDPLKGLLHLRVSWPR